MALDPVVGLTIALLLGWVLAEAGLHKLREPLRFAGIIDAYRLLPRGAGAWLARPLGVTELLVAAALLVPVAHRSAAMFAGLLLCVYFVAIAINLARGRRDIDCGCGGAPQPISAALLLRNAILVALSGWVATGQAVARPTGWLDLLVALGAAVVAILAYASAAQLLSNRQQMVRGR